MDYNCEECGKPIWIGMEIEIIHRSKYMFGKKICMSCREKHKTEYEKDWERLKKAEEKCDKWEKCSRCSGTGKIKGYECQSCSGKGKTKYNDYQGRTCNDAYKDFHNKYPEWWDKS
jgi:RecJ-like exonuclease